MKKIDDTPDIAKRRAREKRIASHMIALYCKRHHKDTPRGHRAFCGEAVCGECAHLDAYTVLRTDRCRKMGEKTSCEKCGNHCYKPEMRERIRAVMRDSGPRMLMRHPLAVIRHMLGK